jgi:hypothetical protein
LEKREITYTFEIPFKTFNILKMNMHVPGNYMKYVAPESELIEFQVEINFLGDSTTQTSTQAQFNFEEGGLGDGGDLL